MLPTAEASVDIRAPLDLVWTIMLDFPAYGAWNPFVYGVECAPGAPAIGADLTLHVRWKNGDTVTSHERISGLEGPSGGRARLEYEFLGPLHTLHLVRGRRVQALEATAGRETRYRTVEQFRGLLRGAVPLANVQDGFERHARALKERAESLASGRES